MDWEKLQKLFESLGYPSQEEFVVKDKNGHTLYIRIMEEARQKILRMWRCVTQANGVAQDPRALAAENESLRFGKLTLERDGIPRLIVEIWVGIQEEPDHESVKKALGFLEQALPIETNEPSESDLDKDDPLAPLVSVMRRLGYDRIQKLGKRTLQMPFASSILSLVLFPKLSAVHMSLIFPKADSESTLRNLAGLNPRLTWGAFGAGQDRDVSLTGSVFINPLEPDPGLLEQCLGVFRRVMEATLKTKSGLQSDDFDPLVQE